jgi:hypothetical protein
VVVCGEVGGRITTERLLVSYLVVKRYSRESRTLVERGMDLQVHLGLEGALKARTGRLAAHRREGENTAIFAI